MSGPGRSGKGSGDENFPVASRLIARDKRPAVMAFYDYARAGDDIADDAGLGEREKLERLDAMERAVRGAVPTGSGPEEALAVRLRKQLEARDLAPDHAARLLEAFRQDAIRARYETWDDLLAYCSRSADPVGRFLLDLHREDPAGYEASDALCTALQILNHVQDCGDDRRSLDRVYVPLSWLSQVKLDETALDRTQMSPALRVVIDRMLNGCDALLAIAATLPPRLADRRLAAESALIVRLASRLSVRLRSGDPLERRIAPRRVDLALATLAAVRTLLVHDRR